MRSLVQNAISIWSVNSQLRQTSSRLKPRSRKKSLRNIWTRFQMMTTTIKDFIEWSSATYRGLQIIVTLFAVAALSSAPKDAGGDTGATEEVVTIICNPQ